MGVDLFLLALLLAFTIYGFIKGFVHEIFVTLGLILGIWLGLEKSYLLSSLSPPILVPEPWNQILRFVIVFVTVFLITMLLRVIVKKFVSAIKLDWLDKIIGGVYGFLQGIVIIWALLLIVLTLSPNSQAIFQRSSVSNRILALGKKAPNLSQEFARFRNRITEFIFKTKTAGKDSNKSNKTRILI
ncbi:MAG: CvpA family protein [candidate division WOR-3 bacterium]